MEPLIQLDYAKWSWDTHTQPRGPPHSIADIRQRVAALPLTPTRNSLLRRFVWQNRVKCVIWQPADPPKAETRAMPHLPSTEKRTDTAHARPSHTAASVGEREGRGNCNHFRSKRQQKRMPGFGIVPTWQPGIALTHSAA